MKPSHYIDLTAIGTSPMEIVTRLVGILHGIARKHNVEYALAFPKIRVGERAHPGSVVQVFGESNTLDKIINGLADNFFIKEYIRLSSIEPVPDTIESWTQYQLYRIPNRKSRTEQTRENRIDAAKGLPYLRVASRSNGHGFSVRIQPVKAIEGSKICEPNSYGLAVTTRPFSLPDIPAR